MMLPPDVWVEHIGNKAEVRALFPSGGLALTGLELIRLEYAPGNKLRIALLHEGLPSDAPQRWRDRGATAVDICLDVGLEKMDLQISREFDELPPLDVLIEANRLFIVAQGADKNFRLEARTFFMRLATTPSGF